MRREAGLVGAVALVALLVGCGGDLPERPPIESVEWAEQGWTAEQRSLYHNTGQGTVIAPVDFFFALERPFSKDKVSDPAYLSALGFLTGPDTAKDPGNPHGLPVGFAVLDDKGPPAGKGLGPVVGLTCAACHTGQLTYQGKAFRIDGGAAGHDLTGFSESFGLTLIETWYNPFKWRRFAKEVLKEKYEDGQAYKTLKARFYPLVVAARRVAWYSFTTGAYPTHEGFTRLDALGRIGNTVFGDDLVEKANYRVADAPVSYPYLWDIWRFDWVQYNGSVHQPMARNVGEALGVRARTNFIDAEGKPVDPTPEKPGWTYGPNFDTSIPVENLHRIETTLWDLTAPKWPAHIFGAVDQAKADKGRELFKENCAKCHGVRPIEQGPDVKAQWAVTMVPLKVIGTDPTVATNFAKEKLDPVKMTGTKDPISPAEGLKVVTDAVKGRAYELAGLDPEKRAEMDGFGRPNLVRAPCAYKARPLAGVWATPPYLHNGAVANVFELLGPEGERQPFWLGSFEYDPKTLGYVKTPIKGGFKMDFKEAGNANTGHHFSDTPGPGVIGRALSPDERYAIIEYLKALTPETQEVLEPVKADWGDKYACEGQDGWWK